MRQVPLLSSVSRIFDLNIATTVELTSPEDLRRQLPESDVLARFVEDCRRTLHRIIFGDDPRFLLVVGPCSIHRVEEGLEYARRLARLQQTISDKVFLVMRAYFEKPRTSIGWKGLIMDPDLDASGNIEEGLRRARGFLLDVLGMGVPTATELLDPITPQYIADLVCWSAIGARTTESQTHRQMASGLSMPLGFKNGTDGEVDSAINAIRAARQPQSFLGISQGGKASIIRTRGNPDCHVVLRGGKNGPNFSPDDVGTVQEKLLKAGLCHAVMVDCSHENSGKDPAVQPEVLRSVVCQVTAGNKFLIGAMLESHLHGGSQSFPAPLHELRPGVSITDACLDWETTESVVREIHRLL